LFLPPDSLPFTLAEIRSRLQALTLYGSDIFVLGNGETISLWGKNSGFDPAGLDYLIEIIGTEDYVRHQRDRTLMKGDRVAAPHGAECCDCDRTNGA
jgi:threonine dehydrogenase-like Zn-dependent dehydrogenase